MAYDLWLAGCFAIKAPVRRHASAYRELTTLSAEQPESPEGRALKRTVAALHFLPRAKAIASEARLAPVRFRPRRDRMPLIRGALPDLDRNYNVNYWPCQGTAEARPKRAII